VAASSPHRSAVPRLQTLCSCLCRQWLANRRVTCQCGARGDTAQRRSVMVKPTL
jgi:hypothetical protein